MKKFSGSIVVGLLLSSFALAGGDIAPVEPAVVVPAPMVDDSGFYVGGAYSFINAETDTYRAYGFDVDPDPVYWERETLDSDTSGFMLQLGYQFNKYIAVEGRYWNGGTNMDYTYADSDFDEYTDSWSCADLTAWGIYVKPMFPVTDAVSIYGLLGYGNTQSDDRIYYGNGVYQLLDDNGFQWGVGLSYAYDEHISFFVDYVRLANNEGGSHDYNAGVIDPTYDYNYVNWETSVYTVNFGVSYKF